MRADAAQMALHAEHHQRHHHHHQAGNQQRGKSRVHAQKLPLFLIGVVAAQLGGRTVERQRVVGQQGVDDLRGGLLLQLLGQAKKEAAEYLEALQRERAEFINFRNRAQKEQERFRQHGIIDVLTALLPALDDIDRIREHSEMDDSFKAVANKIDKAFEKFGVEKFGEKGEDFDPTKHDAILHKPDPNAEKETVDTVVEAGYRIGDRVIRAARVVVASPQN